VITINRTYPWSFVTQIFRNVNQAMVATLKRLMHILLKHGVYFCNKYVVCIDKSISVWLQVKHIYTLTGSLKDIVPCCILNIGI